MIQITKRFQLFSHNPGIKALIPHTDWTITAFPTKVILSRGEEVHEIDLLITGPVKGFTLMQDLEKGVIRLFGTPKEGYFSLLVAREENTLIVKQFRGEPIRYRYSDQEKVLSERLRIRDLEPFAPKKVERLSLGIDKKLEWELIERRSNLKEMLPVLFCLGQKTPYQEGLTPSLLSKEEEFLSWILSGFSGLFVPERKEVRHLGLSWKGFDKGMPLGNILHAGYQSIRNLFLREEEGNISLLPDLLPHFDEGRLIGAKLSFGEIHIEWTKRNIRRVQMIAEKKANFSLTCKEGIKTFRLKRHPKEKGRVLSTREPLSILPHERYFLDKFES